MISAGLLDRRLTFQKRVLVRDEMGAAKETFINEFVSVPAMIKYWGGREKYSDGSERRISTRDYRFITRYFPGLTETHRILFENQYWDIMSLQELPRRQGWDIVAQKVQ